MRLDEISHILDANNIQYIKIQNGIQENHANNEDYYELKNLKEKGYIYYHVQEKNNNEFEIFQCDIAEANKFFLIILLSKAELEYSRDKRTELFMKMSDVQTISDIPYQIKKYNIMTDYFIGENKEVTINIIIKEKEYLLCINKNSFTVYSEKIDTFAKVKNRLIFFLLKNDFLTMVMEKGKYEGYILKMNQEDYKHFFEPLQMCL
jgi:hypothetical protein